MTSERWQQIERICQEAAAVPPNLRPALLDRACAGNEDLRMDVDRMLAGEMELRRFLEAQETGIAGEDKPVIRLKPGTRVGPYEIVSLLGIGGMGEVYRARDSRLNRTVAVKVLPQNRSADFSLRRRLLREAQTACALNHKNIVTIHDVISEGDRVAS